MAKFNELQKKRRAQKSIIKRQLHGDPNSKKLKVKPQPVSLSGKRKQKLLRRWRKNQKEAIEQGLVTMEDVEMDVADETSGGSSKSPTKVNAKKGLKLKKLKQKGKKSRGSKSAAAEPSVDVMVE